MRLEKCLGVVSRLALGLLIGSGMLGFVGWSQSSPGSNLQELLEMVSQPNDPATLETILKNIERSAPLTSLEETLLIEALSHVKWEVQRAAILALGNGRVTDAAPRLLEKLELLSNQTPNAQTEAEVEKWNQGAVVAEALVAALAAIRDERTIEPLLMYPELYTTHMGVKPIVAFGVSALPALLKIARDPQDERRVSVLSLIANIRDVQAIPMLMEAANGAEAEIRKSALSALRGLQVAEAVPLFEAQLADPDPDTRLTALMALVAIQPETYVSTAILFLQDPSPVIRSQTIDLLGRLNRVEAIEPLEKLLQNSHDVVRYRAAKALGKLTGRAYPYKRTKMVALFERLGSSNAK
ncbi:MAG: HEAT repeat domain-containing protein [Acidobacteria bacterium]|nr:HEAT repeat domain-containing protein [Acidobacteriota bacterium]MBI3656845.1 HEAT repeat domain-containing protein [Acidobacteriota bacterium]